MTAWCLDRVQPNCAWRLGLAERRCERRVPASVWLQDVAKDIMEDVLRRGFGAKDVAGFQSYVN